MMYGGISDVGAWLLHPDTTYCKLLLHDLGADVLLAIRTTVL